MPVSFPRPTFNLSRTLSPHDGDDGWAAWEARLDAGRASRPAMDPAVVAQVRANEALLCGRAERRGR